jgi:hypothetical protein
MFMDQQSDNATTSTEPMADSTDDDLVDDIMGQFDVDFDTLCVHVAQHIEGRRKTSTWLTDQANGEPCCCSTW